MKTSITYDEKTQTATCRIGDECLIGQNEIFDRIINKIEIPGTVKKIIFDFEKVSYINSMGIAEFIALFRYFNDDNNGSVKFLFRNVNRYICEIFSLIEFSKLCEIVPLEE